MKSITNLTLCFVLFLVLSIPILGSHFVLNLGGLEGSVAGARVTTDLNVNIIPNIQDFSEYAGFFLNKINDNEYKDNLKLTVFQRQRATYQGLYNIYNLSSTQKVKLEITTLGVEKNDFSKLLLTAVNDEQYVPSTLEEAVDSGSTLLRINSANFSIHEKIIVGNELATVIDKSEGMLVVTPLTEPHTAGEYVYPESIFLLSPDRLINPRTKSIILEPRGKATIDLLVEGVMDARTGDTQINLPITFRIEPVL